MRLLTIAVSLWLTAVGSTQADDYVIIESRSFPQGRRNCQVGVYFANKGPINGLVFTFELRELDPGVYPAANLSFLENPMSRLYYSALGSHSLNSLPGSQTTRFYDVPGNQYCSTPPTNSYTAYVASDTSHYPNPDSPDGMSFSAVSRGSEQDLEYQPPGADTPGVSLPSLIIEFDAGTTTGRFEIDTCCVTPANHLLFVECTSTTQLYCQGPIILVTPAFTKSIVTIVPCTCLCASDPNCDGVTNILDVATAIDVAFRGNADIMDSTCAVSRTDTNADYQTDIVDVVRLILVAFREAPADSYLINPCE